MAGLYRPRQIWPYPRLTKESSDLAVISAAGNAGAARLRRAMADTAQLAIWFLVIDGKTHSLFTDQLYERTSHSFKCNIQALNSCCLEELSAVAAVVHDLP